MAKLLLVEDEEALRDAFSIILEALPYECDFAANGKIALEMCQQSTYDLVFLDLMMPVMDGVGFLEGFRKNNTDTKVIVMSNLSSSKLLKKALKLGIHRSILKANMSPEQFISLIRKELNSTSSQE